MSKFGEPKLFNYSLKFNEKFRQDFVGKVEFSHHRFLAEDDDKDNLQLRYAGRKEDD